MSSSHTVPRIDIPEVGQISTNKFKGMSRFTSISLNDLFEADLGANCSSWQHLVQRDLVRPQMGKFHMLGVGRKGTRRFCFGTPGDTSAVAEEES